eukprot:COSAG02_NODE_23_length_52893_cov_58.101868_59_plen_209_part_00
MKVQLRRVLVAPFVVQALDAKGEWYLHRPTRTLYLRPNTTKPEPPALGSLVAPVLERLISIRGESSVHPVAGIEILNVSFYHAAPTYLSPSGFSTMLGGGDYAMNKNAALIGESVRGLVVSGCTFSRLGGNALLLYGYIRDAVVSRNAVVSWGVADMGDGTTDAHPDGVQVSLNVASEIGLIEKQGAMIGSRSVCTCCSTFLHQRNNV